MGAGRNPAALGLLFTWTRGTAALTPPIAVYDQLTEPQSRIEWISSGGGENFVSLESFKKK